jgi:hypothetical protein
VRSTNTVKMLHNETSILLYWRYTPLRILAPPWSSEASIFFWTFLLPLWNLGLISQFLDHFTDGRLLGRVISSSQGFYLNTGQHKHRINAYTHQTSMPYMGFEPTTPASERAKTVHALDRSATVTGEASITVSKFEPAIGGLRLYAT